MKPQLEIQGLHIVVLGSFTPSLFQPAWLASHGLIKQTEAEQAQIELIHRDASIFQLDWLYLNVLNSKLQVGTSQVPYYEPVRDVLLGIFGILQHVPLTAFGINRHFHYRLESEESWHQIGNIIAPKEPWAGMMHQPGMRSIVIEDPKPDSQGYTQVKVTPSNQISNNGILVEVNDHHNLHAQTNSNLQTDEFTGLISEHWGESMTNAENIANSVVKLGGSR